jgi:L-lactate dehydrogenase complex protein LldG
MNEADGKAKQGTVLDDVRRALGRRETVKPEPLAPFPEASAAEEAEALLARFIGEATAVGAFLYRADNDEQAGDLIGQICDRASVTEVAVSGAERLVALRVPAHLATHNQSVIATDEMSAGSKDRLINRLASCGAGITAVEYAIAETGTLVLTSDEELALLVSLLPPIHIAVLRPSQIRSTLTAVVNELSENRMRGDTPCRSTTFITGPSRTSDVELTLSIGVHGPKELHVIVLGE